MPLKKITPAERAYQKLEKIQHQIRLVMEELAAEMPTKKRNVGPLIVKHNGRFFDFNNPRGGRQK